ncbi:MAG: hypothetical protein D6B25_12555 [Desulfobulbaceae bacterium]|nr:MAG: hypothetical protein D6B25_12555 [Desulfobulbaceae bacterium]
MALFVSFVSGFCFLTGLMKLMSGLLLSFGVIAAVFFGVVFLLPGNDERLWFPIYGDGAAWPFFLLALVLVGVIIWLFKRAALEPEPESFSNLHTRALGWGGLIYLAALFLPAFLWFPSEAKRLVVDDTRLGIEVFIGVLLYIGGTIGALYFFYKASKGGTAKHPDMMRRFVLALFSALHLDKMPALVAYLLIYSPETGVVFPKVAALALAAYIPIGFFLSRICAESKSP